MRACVPIFLLLAAALLPPPASARDRDFDAAVGQIAAVVHSRPAHRHLLGLVDLIARIAHPVAARGLHMALLPPSLGRQPDLVALPGQLIARLPGWQCVVRDIEPRDHEASLLFMRPHGASYRVLIVAFSATGVAVVQASIPRREIVANVDQSARGRGGVRLGGI